MKHFWTVLFFSIVLRSVVFAANDGGAQQFIAGVPIQAEVSQSRETHTGGAQQYVAGRPMPSEVGQSERLSQAERQPVQEFRAPGQAYPSFPKGDPFVSYGAPVYYAPPVYYAAPVYYIPLETQGGYGYAPQPYPAYPPAQTWPRQATAVFADDTLPADPVVNPAPKKTTGKPAAPGVRAVSAQTHDATKPVQVAAVVVIPGEKHASTAHVKVKTSNIDTEMHVSEATTTAQLQALQDFTQTQAATVAADQQTQRSQFGAALIVALSICITIPIGYLILRQINKFVDGLKELKLIDIQHTEKTLQLADLQAKEVAHERTQGHYSA